MSTGIDREAGVIAGAVCLEEAAEVKEQRREGSGGLVQSALWGDRRAKKNWSEARGAKYLKS